MADNWIADVPGIKDLIDGTGEADVTLARVGKLRVGTGLAISVSGDKATLTATGEGGEDSPTPVLQPDQSLTGASNSLPLTAGTTVTVDHGSATQLIVQPHATIAHPVGIRIPIVAIGTGQVEIVAGSGVTINYPASLSLYLAEQWSTAELWQGGQDVWVLTGDLQPA